MSEAGRIDPQMALALAIAGEARQGWRVEAQGPWQVSLVRGKRPNHILHLILSIVTVGLWLPVWFFITVTTREHRNTLVVNEYGQVFNSWQLRQAELAAQRGEGWAPPGVLPVERG